MVLIASSIFTHNALAQAKYIEGIDYSVLEEPLPLQKTGEKEVVEFFSFACPHCASLHPVLTEWAETKKPADTGFYEIPALGGGWTFVGRVKFTADKLGAGSDFEKAYFDALHKDRNRKLLGSKEDAFAFIDKYTNVGVDAVEKAWGSLAVKNKMRHSVELWQKSKLTSVPVIIVNGKYVVKLSVQGTDRMLNVVDFLLATTKP